jgi:hypothetical protein
MKSLVVHNIINKRMFADISSSSQASTSIPNDKEEDESRLDDNHMDLSTEVDIEDELPSPPVDTASKYTTSDINNVVINFRSDSNRFTEEENELFLEVLKKPGVHTCGG